MKSFAVLLVAGVVNALVAGPALAGPDEKPEDCPVITPQPGSEEFEQLKTLAGTWKGMSDHGPDGPQEVTLEYEVTSGGTALIEREFPGSPHAMISVFHDRDGKPMMTHYCMLGNQPMMELQSAQPGHMEFSLAKCCSGLEQQPHMHSLKIDFLDADHITQTWEMYENGQSKMTTKVELKRVK